MSTIHTNENDIADEASFKRVLMQIQLWYYFLLSKWKIIVLAAIIGGALGFLKAKFKDPVYTATTTFVLEDSGSGNALGQYAGLASMVGVDLGGGSGGGIFQGDNILELYKSRSVIEKALLTPVEIDGKKRLLIDLYLDFTKARESWAEKPKLKDISFQAFMVPIDQRNTLNFTRLQDSVLGEVSKEIIKNYLTVDKADKKLSLITATVKSTDEDFSKLFNDHIVQNVNDFYIKTKTKKSTDNIKLLQQKTDSVRNLMNGAIYNAAVVSDETPNLNPTRQVQRSAPMQRSQFAIETNKAVLTELTKNLEISKLASQKDAPLIQIVDAPIYPLEKSKGGKVTGIIIGAFLGGFLTSLYLMLRKLFKLILNNN